MATEVDLLIVGAGPTGLYAAYYAGFRGMSVALVDSLSEPGGQLTALYPEKPIYDVAGFPSVLARDLARQLVEQASSADPVYLLGRRAESLARQDGGLLVGLDDGQQVRATAVVVTAGIGTFTPRTLPGGDRFEGRGLRYVVTDLSALDDKNVLIVGGGDSAVDWALVLAERAASVTLIHRRPQFRAHEGSVSQLLASKAHVLTPYVPGEVIGGDDGRVQAVDVVNKDTEETLRIEVDEVIAALGFVADLGPLQSWGLQLDKRHVLVDSTMATNIPGVFAAGDVVEYPGKVRLISTAFGEAATAVNNAAPIIDPTAKVFPGHSSDAGLH
jgi:ferredoxin/flavodoxin---NADP+ reductase